MNSGQHDEGMRDGVDPYTLAWRSVARWQLAMWGAFIGFGVFGAVLAVFREALGIPAGVGRVVLPVLMGLFWICFSRAHSAPCPHCGKPVNRGKKYHGTTARCVNCGIPVGTTKAEAARSSSWPE